MKNPNRLYLIPIALLIFLAEESYAQSRAVFKSDTARYAGRVFYSGGSVDLWYGSSNDKSFAFVFMGSGWTGLYPLRATYGKHRVLLDKVYEMQGKVYARGVLVDAPEVRAMGGNKIFIDIEGAVDNKELAEPEKR
jgi:hypothetical protein